MAALTRHGASGYGTRRVGSFAGKTPAAGSSHPVVRITRPMSGGHGTRRSLTGFAGKTASAASGHPVVRITRPMSSGYGTRRSLTGFAGKTADDSIGVSEWIIRARRRGRR